MSRPPGSGGTQFGAFGDGDASGRVGRRPPRPPLAEFAIWGGTGPGHVPVTGRRDGASRGITAPVARPAAVQSVLIPSRGQAAHPAAAGPHRPPQARSGLPMARAVESAMNPTKWAP